MMRKTSNYADMKDTFKTNISRVPITVWIFIALFGTFLVCYFIFWDYILAWILISALLNPLMLPFGLFIFWVIPIALIVVIAVLVIYALVKAFKK